MTDGIVRVVDQLSQLSSQIEPLGTRRPIVHLLQQDQIGIVVIKDVGNSIEPKTPVDADGAVYVVR